MLGRGAYGLGGNLTSCGTSQVHQAPSSQALRLILTKTASLRDAFMPGACRVALFVRVLEMATAAEGRSSRPVNRS